MAKKNNNKGVNVEKVSKIFKDAPSVDELFGNVEKANEEVVIEIAVEEELVENNMVGGKDMSIVEMVMQDEKEMVLASEEDVKEELEVMEVSEVKGFIDIVNMNIKGAIAFYKNYVSDKKVVSGKQIQSVIKQYKNVTGLDMNEEQLNCIKKLNDRQVSSVIYVLNQALKYKKKMEIA